MGIKVACNVQDSVMQWGGVAGRGGDGDGDGGSGGGGHPGTVPCTVACDYMYIQ